MLDLIVERRVRLADGEDDDEDDDDCVCGRRWPAWRVAGGVGLPTIVIDLADESNWYSSRGLSSAGETSMVVIG